MTAIQMVLVMALVGCSALIRNGSRSPTPEEKRDRNISAALLEGKPEAARELLAAALRAEPQNGYLHLLNGLSYQLTESSQQSLELAKVGYDAAVKFAPGYFWSHYFSGLVALERRDYPEAAEQFSWAILDKPDHPHAFVGLAVTAYYAGDLEVARVAAERAVALAPRDPLGLKTAAYIAAARGDRISLDAVLARAKAVPAAARDLEIHRPRLSQLLRTGSLAQGVDNPGNQQVQDQSPAVPGPVTSGDPKQIMVEVTLLLSQDSTTRHIGINLLDGLTLQFGAQQLTQKTIVMAATDTLSRTITTSLLLPQITYSLNLFNTKDDFYDVIARPSLVATLGQESEFFIGNRVTIGVSGINLGSLQPVDVGTEVKVTPAEITRERTKFKIDIIRSFFVDNTAGTFQQALTTFKQTLGGTVEVEFGKTLILSGLFEAVNVGGFSKVPILGDIPVVDVLTNARVRTQKRNAALVLVTPRLPGSIETGTREFRSDTLNRLLLMWENLIDPTSSMDRIIHVLGYKVSNYFRPQAGDLRLPSVSDPDTVRLVIKETMGRLH
jgi:Tfp pilus assembly protein PilF